MRGVLLIVLCCCLAGGVVAQSGYFSQNSSRIKDYEEQVAELEAYLALAAKGFTVVQSGITQVQQIKQGEFNLHNAFYTALGQVNPQVSGMAEVAEIVALQVATVQRFKAVLSQPGLGTSELATIGAVYAAVVQLCLADVVLLGQLLTAGTLTMSDGERVSRIEALDVSARERYGFAVSYTDGVGMLAAQRAAALSEIAELQGLY